VCAEALLSGCPVLASNFAAFVEHVQPGDGFLCGSRQEFTLGLRYMLDYLSQDKVADREARRERAVARWGYDAVGLRYAAAFMAIKRDWENGVRP
jgi:glycosyltransferase involved in cell wall biosynthesis